MHGAGTLDPGNPHWIPHVHGGRSSVLTLPGAYRHPAWPDQPVIDETPTPVTVTACGVNRRVWHWRPEQPNGLVLVLFDGEAWVELGLGHVLHSAGIATEVILIESVDLQQRALDLPDPRRAAELVEVALSTVGTVRPEDVMVSGQSFGGLAAASVVIDHPDLARHAIVQSGSFWYRRGVVPERHLREPGDLVECLRRGEIDLHGRRFDVQAGTDESGMADLAENFTDAASRAGAEIRHTEVRGGHDYAWWRHHLLRSLLS